MSDEEVTEMMNAPAAGTAPLPPPAEEYAVVEVFGHRRHVGRIMEVERFGAKLLRIDVPTDGDFEKGYVTHLYGGTAIFSCTGTDLASVIEANKPWMPSARNKALTARQGIGDDSSPEDDDPDDFPDIEDIPPEAVEL